MKVLEFRFTPEQLEQKFCADFDRGVLVCRKTGREILNRPNKDGYLRVGIRDNQSGKHNLYYVHDVIFYMRHGWLPEQIDHVNHVKNDNRISNLQSSDYALQQVNMPKKQGTTSLYKGVCYYANKASKRWRASLCHNKKHKSFGYYETQEEAARAYDRAAYAIWGEVSVQHLNFPDEPDNYQKPFEEPRYRHCLQHLME